MRFQVGAGLELQVANFARVRPGLRVDDGQMPVENLLAAKRLPANGTQVDCRSVRRLDVVAQAGRVGKRPRALGAAVRQHLPPSLFCHASRFACCSTAPRRRRRVFGRRFLLGDKLLSRQSGEVSNKQDNFQIILKETSINKPILSFSMRLI